MNVLKNNTDETRRHVMLCKTAERSLISSVCCSGCFTPIPCPLSFKYRVWFREMMVNGGGIKASVHSAQKSPSQFNAVAMLQSKEASQIQILPLFSVSLFACYLLLTAFYRLHGCMVDDCNLQLASVWSLDMI